MFRTQKFYRGCWRVTADDGRYVHIRKIRTEADGWFWSGQEHRADGTPLTFCGGSNLLRDVIDDARCRLR